MTKATPAPKSPVSVILVGIGGMGAHYLAALLEDFSPRTLRLRAVVDPFPDRSGHFDQVKNLDIPVFSSLEEAFGNGVEADLTVISSPHHFHVEQSLLALRRGCQVLCEKPVAATIQDALRLIQEKEAAGGRVRVGYQWSFSSAIQALKKDILKGAFGAPIRFKAFYLWPRDEAYYRRNTWAGRIKDEPGIWVLDSPAASAMAHDLHNLFYLLGDGVERSAWPAEVTAEAYRAYPIENYDTVACRALTEEGTEVLFYASHAVEKELGPFFSLEFENASVLYGEKGADIVAKDHAAGEKHYGSPFAEPPLHKLYEAVRAVHETRPVLCGPEAASPHTLCVNGIQESCAKVQSFPEDMVRKEGQGRRWVMDLAEVFFQCYSLGVLPGEAGFSWAERGREINLQGYRFYPGGQPPAKEGE